ncbi:hypothetical protein CONCODRAFT_75865 [Conidiobolus coronatus NRRL 28638]|uniref:Pirin N-terminal domain-containing protein n=1 Tax=Conidiobolus coronatus (strain ATCC 28846 / CBS 209.66 / NRRL 28638) TaxID=796925 RepID=A0A137P347_CONC2|nr:hypothetical protein CONCODRAFT_75865 [Conidiobolus coronatus NRRL 28638]|eukprot:KXN69457.1 hypothetical protein CONCODRAFT_75865 [Conidiobolus coronatus NRRL 28638]
MNKISQSIVNNTQRSIRKVINQVSSIAKSEGTGATVYRSIGTRKLRNLDPFLMLDEFHVSYPAGFPDHPHRGFETVTYMLTGQTAHEDFVGHKGVIGPGDLQWMTAGKGIVHAEMPAIKDPNFESTGLQLWVNLANKDKMIDPGYQDLKDINIPRAKPTEGVEIKVIAGESFGVNSPVCTKTPVMYLDFKLEANKSVEQAIPSEFQTAFIYTLSGKIKPLNEPISQRGPFVMSNDNDLFQTFMDYQTNQNGFERAKHWESEIGKN